VEKVRKNEIIYNRALDIIEQCKEERNKLKDFILSNEKTLINEFPLAIKEYTQERIMELKRYIFKTGQLLPVVP
jgi:hypothetical protein